MIAGVGISLYAFTYWNKYKSLMDGHNQIIKDNEDLSEKVDELSYINGVLQRTYDYYMKQVSDQNVLLDGIYKICPPIYKVAVRLTSINK